MQTATASTEPVHREPPTVTVVICAYTERRWQLLIEALAAVQGQSQEPDELILVIDHNPVLESRLRTLAVSEWKVISNKFEKGLSGARNSGVAIATSDIVAFLDDDAIPAPDWLEHLVVPFQDENTAGVGGWVEAAWVGRPPTWWPHTFNWVVGCSYTGLPDDGSPIRNPIGASMAIRRDLIASCGAFSTRLGRVGTLPLGCEETELALRIASRHPGRPFVHATRSRVDHSVQTERGTLLYFIRRCAAEGVSKARITALSPGATALASERTYLRVTIPGAIASELRGPHLSSSSVRRAAAMVLGVLVTGSAYVTARLLSALPPYRGSSVRPRVRPLAAEDGNHT